MPYMHFRSWKCTFALFQTKLGTYTTYLWYFLFLIYTEYFLLSITQDLWICIKHVFIVVKINVCFAKWSSWIILFFIWPCCVFYNNRHPEFYFQYLFVYIMCLLSNLSYHWYSGKELSSRKLHFSISDYNVLQVFSSWCKLSNEINWFKQDWARKLV